MGINLIKKIKNLPMKYFALIAAASAADLTSAVFTAFADACTATTICATGMECCDIAFDGVAAKKLCQTDADVAAWKANTADKTMFNQGITLTTTAHTIPAAKLSTFTMATCNDVAVTQTARAAAPGARPSLPVLPSSPP